MSHQKAKFDSNLAGNLKFNIKAPNAIIFKTKWYMRLWYLISNPFLYMFKGKIRY